jgi:branched-chain amino acid transport system substrate-binding protein
VVKIGLIAPFEGIYRQSGYEALAAMRAAIDESEIRSLAVLPLALDSGADPVQARRTMQKLLTDPSVKAVVGPFHPEFAVAVADLMGERANNWFLPFLPSSIEERNQALAALVAAVVDQVGGDQDAPVVLAGLTPGWPNLSAAEWSEQVGRPVRLSSDPSDVAPSEAVIWLGSAADGARYLIQLRSLGMEIPLWLPIAGDLPIFHQRVAHGLEMLPTRPPLGLVYWTAWLDDGYETWAATHSPNSPTAYAVYRATERAIAEIAGLPSRSAASATPRLYIFQLGEDGKSQPTNFTQDVLE